MYYFSRRDRCKAAKIERKFRPPSRATAASNDKAANSEVRSPRSTLIALLLAVIPCSAEAADVKAIAAAVDAHYNHLRSLEAEFTEVYRGRAWSAPNRGRCG